MSLDESMKLYVFDINMGFWRRAAVPAIASDLEQALERARGHIQMCGFGEVEKVCVYDIPRLSSGLFDLGTSQPLSLKATDTGYKPIPPR